MRDGSGLMRPVGFAGIVGTAGLRGMGRGQAANPALREFVTALNFAVLKVGSLRRLELAGMTFILFSTAYASIFSSAIGNYDGNVVTRCIRGVLRGQSIQYLLACGVGPHAIALVLFDAVDDVPRPPAMERHVIAKPVRQVQVVFVEDYQSPLLPKWN
jgi:hypothetical protein